MMLSDKRYKSFLEASEKINSGEHVPDFRKIREGMFELSLEHSGGKIIGNKKIKELSLICL